MEMNYFFYALVKFKKKYQVVEVPCDFDTAKKKAESQRKLIKIIDDLRRS